MSASLRLRTCWWSLTPGERVGTWSSLSLHKWKSSGFVGQSQGQCFSSQELPTERKVKNGRLGERMFYDKTRILVQGGKVKSQILV